MNLSLQYPPLTVRVSPFTSVTVTFGFRRTSDSKSCGPFSSFLCRGSDSHGVFYPSLQCRTRRRLSYPGVLLTQTEYLSRSFMVRSGYDPRRLHPLLVSVLWLLLTVSSLRFPNPLGLFLLGPSALLPNSVDLLSPAGNYRSLWDP